MTAILRAATTPGSDMQLLCCLPCILPQAHSPPCPRFCTEGGPDLACAGCVRWVQVNAIQGLSIGCYKITMTSTMCPSKDHFVILRVTRLKRFLM